MQKQRLCASVLNQSIITWGFNALEYRVKGVATQDWTRIVLSINLGFKKMILSFPPSIPPPPPPLPRSLHKALPWTHQEPCPPDHIVARLDKRSYAPAGRINLNV